MRRSASRPAFLAAALAAALGAALLSACAAGPAPVPTESSGPSAPSSTPDSAPSQLVGLWRVAEAEGESPETWLWIGDGEAVLWRPCGPISLSWTAVGDLALFSLTDWSDACRVDGESPAASWLTAARSFRTGQEAATLLDGTGERTASLVDDGTAPPPSESMPDSYREPPELTEDLAAALDAEPAPLPGDVEPVTRETLIGRWLPADYDGPTQPDAQFFDDGTWRASDGCNEAAGSWALGPDGLLLATAGFTTLIGCEGIGTGGAVSQAGRAAIEGERLLLFGTDGERLLELVRA